jgi:hypothetical protein
LNHEDFKDTSIERHAAQRPTNNKSFEKPQATVPIEWQKQEMKPILSPLIKNEPPGLLTVLGNNDIDRARREEVKKMVQYEYN